MPQTDKATILVVDDTPQNIDVLTGILRSDYRVKAALNGALALKVASAEPRPDLILLDVMMPDMDGYEVCRQLKSRIETQAIPVIFVTAKSEEQDEALGFSLGAVDYISKPVNPLLVLARVKSQLALYNQARHLENIVQQRTRELNETRLEIIRRLGRAAEFKDNETGMHVIRMSWFSRFLAEQIGQPDAWCELLFNAAPMHDIGKIGIPDNVLLKPGALDAEQWQMMQQHVQFGVDILGDHPSPLLQMAREVALFHHEKWDGSGYPHGVSGTDIPLSARIVAIADVFDALTSKRPYKNAWTEEQAVTLLKEQSGKHFDSQLVQEFVGCLPQIRDVQARYTDDI
ncbi:two-component system response regulator [Bowmanella denitrificans]|uniref:Two-component system response regulator n=1 Tax=Bowmanella denitrificans TaxID=366582 RepID=A0ABN0X977_9ALTE